MKFEQKLATLIENKNYDVIAHELWADDGGWSVNDSWKLGSSLNKEDSIAAAKARWEVFKLNYMPKARVMDIEDVGYMDNEIILEVNYVPFLTLLETN